MSHDVVGSDPRNRYRNRRLWRFSDSGAAIEMSTCQDLLSDKFQKLTLSVIMLARSHKLAEWQSDSDKWAQTEMTALGLMPKLCWQIQVKYVDLQGIVDSHASFNHRGIDFRLSG